MINEQTGQRELAYVVAIDEIRPIEGYDRVEYARVNGWWVIIYAEIQRQLKITREKYSLIANLSINTNNYIFSEKSCN